MRVTYRLHIRDEVADLAGFKQTSGYHPWLHHSYFEDVIPLSHMVWHQMSQLLVIQSARHNLYQAFHSPVLNEIGSEKECLQWFIHHTRLFIDWRFDSLNDSFQYLRYIQALLCWYLHSINLILTFTKRISSSLKSNCSIIYCLVASTSEAGKSILFMIGMTVKPYHTLR